MSTAIFYFNLYLFNENQVPKAFFFPETFEQNRLQKKVESVDIEKYYIKISFGAGVG